MLAQLPNFLDMPAGNSWSVFAAFAKGRPLVQAIEFRLLSHCRTEKPHSEYLQYWQPDGPISGTVEKNLNYLVTVPGLPGNLKSGKN